MWVIHQVGSIATQQGAEKGCRCLRNDSRCLGNRLGASENQFFFAESCIKSVTFGFICNVARTWCSFSGMQESSQPWLGGHGNFKSMAFSCILHTGSWYVFRCGLLHGSTVKHHYSGWWNIDWLLRPNRNPAFQKELMNTNPPDMYIYIIIYICIQFRTYTSTYTLIHIYKRIHMYTNMIYTHIYIYTHIHIHIDSYRHIHIFTYSHICYTYT